MKLTKKFIAAVSLMASSALTTGAQAQDKGINASLSDLESRLNLNQNTFYHPAAGLIVEEDCAVKGDDIQCNMTVITGGLRRVQQAQMTYITNDNGALTVITAQADKAQFYTNNGAYEGNDTNTAVSDHYDEQISAVSMPDLNAKEAEANKAGFNKIYDYIYNRIGGFYLTASSAMTEIETAVADAGIFAYDGKFRPLDRLVRIQELTPLARDGEHKLFEVGCKLIPPANTAHQAYDVDMEQAERMICVKNEFYKDPESLEEPLKNFDKVTATFSILALGEGGALVSESFVDQKAFSATALGASSDHDQGNYEATYKGLINPQGVRETTGNRLMASQFD